MSGLNGIVVGIILTWALAIALLYLALWFVTRRLAWRWRMGIFAVPLLALGAWITFEPIIYRDEHLYERVFQTGVADEVADLKTSLVTRPGVEIIDLRFRAPPQSVARLLDYFTETPGVRIPSPPTWMPFICSTGGRIYAGAGLYGWTELLVAHCPGDGSVSVHARQNFDPSVQR
ncbi:hypothetical protein ACFSM5_04910 [Lacibacterium aquatile]|uniref:Uncharacterized protein n=1 Tax=Lacibacterium aquatile TaxID=1168082 RepID=A0ABW5DNV1_9PROT